MEENKFLKLKEAFLMYKNAFLWAFVLINLAFLFHTANFMFGDHDWNYIRMPNYWSEGAFEGRPLHFVLQSVLFGGEVLPVLNNLFSFAALSISGILLARYWQVPFSTFNYALFATFAAVLPYTMVWLFYAKDTLINLSLPLIGVTALLLAEVSVEHKKPLWHLGAVALFYFAFASYAAMINFFGVCALGGILTSYLIKKEPLWNIIKKNLPLIADIIIALVLFKLTISFLPLTSDYNTGTIPPEYLAEKLKQTLRAMFAQFITPLPFMEQKFKLLLALLFITGALAAFFRGGVSRIPAALVLLLALLFSSKFAFFIADERGKILAEMENFAFVPRLDFYGLAYVYALGLAWVLSALENKAKKAGIILAVIITFMAIVRDVYAQKVWKFGFDAEMKAHERIVSRLESRPDFYPARKYRLLQIGSLALRENYYLKTQNEETSLDLLSTSFTPEFMSRIVYNFYYPEDIFYDNASAEALSPAGKTWLITKARPWPLADSIYIDGDIVIIVLTETALNKARAQLMKR